MGKVAAFFYMEPVSHSYYFRYIRFVFILSFLSGIDSLPTRISFELFWLLSLYGSTPNETVLGKGSPEY